MIFFFIISWSPLQTIITKLVNIGLVLNPVLLLTSNFVNVVYTILGSLFSLHNPAPSILFFLSSLNLFVKIIFRYSAYTKCLKSQFYIICSKFYQICIPFITMIFLYISHNLLLGTNIFSIKSYNLLFVFCFFRTNTLRYFKFMCFNQCDTFTIKLQFFLLSFPFMFITNIIFVVSSSFNAKAL